MRALRREAMAMHGAVDLRIASSDRLPRGREKKTRNSGRARKAFTSTPPTLVSTLCCTKPRSGIGLRLASRARVDFKAIQSY